MPAGLIYPHVSLDPDGVARLVRVPRVRVAQLATEYVAYGWSADELCDQHPFLTLAEAHAALAYYFDHQAEIDAEIAGELKSLANAPLPESPFVRRMRAEGRWPTRGVDRIPSC